MDVSVRLRLVRFGLHFMIDRPFRLRPQWKVKPRKSKVDGPIPDCFGRNQIPPPMTSRVSVASSGSLDSIVKRPS